MGGVIHPFNYEEVGITGPMKSYHVTLNYKEEYICFFCAMIKREVIEKVGLLDEIYEVGGCEDVDYSVKINILGYKSVQVPNNENYYFPNNGDYYFPIYHIGHLTLMESLKHEVFLKNCEIVKERYNTGYYRYTWYKWKLMNNWERMLFFKDEEITFREKARYEWAAKNIVGVNVLEIGCSNGYGTRLLPQNINYLGIDYDKEIIKEAQEYGDNNHKFECFNINEYNFDNYDTIIAFEIIEHLENGKEILQKLKNHCRCLLATVPYRELPNTWHSSSYHKFYGLSEADFSGFEYKFISEDGNIIDAAEKEDGTNSLLMKWIKSITPPTRGGACSLS